MIQDIEKMVLAGQMRSRGLLLRENAQALASHGGLKARFNC
jgi:hypothetical protein